MSDFQLNADEFNSLFGEAINRGGDALEKTAEVTGSYIQDKLRENSFARRVLPPQVVTTAELTRNTTDEGLSYIDDIEPDSLAMQINMRGEPSKTYIEAKRYEIRFTTISSDKFQKSESELRSYRMPLTKVLEQNTVKDIQEQEDKIFMDHVRTAVFLATRRRMNTLVDRGTVTHEGDDMAQATGKNFNSKYSFASYIYTRNVANAGTSGAVGDGGALSPSAGAPATHGWDADFDATHPNYNPANAVFSNFLTSTATEFDRNVLRDLMKVQPAREMKGRVFLLHEVDWTDTIAWSDTEAGLEITSEITRDGYKYTTVGGYTFVTTVRDNPNIVQPGQMFSFPAPEFLGRFLLLEGTRFFIDKRGRFIEFEAWEEVGMGFGNIKGIGSILLSGASIDMPNLFQNSAGTALNTTGTFTFYNDPGNPFNE